MTRQNAFRSALAKDALRYVALKRTLGRSFENATSVLLNLDGFLLALGNPPADLTAETFRQWSQALMSLSPNTRLAHMRIVRNFCIYRRRVTPDCFVPDPSQFPKACSLLRPHIFSETEVARLLGYCDALPENPARSPLRWAGTRLAIVLLYTTGLRRGELFRLTPLDYDPSAYTLLIRASKFHKSRLLPLPGDLAKEVDRHLKARCEAYPSALAAEPLLWSPYSGDRAYTGARLQANLRLLLDRAGIKNADGRRPRIHDFRHSFAVNALIRWYRAGVDVQAKLPLLATWLGHVSILSTYHYLHFVEELRLVASNRFTESYGGLVVPVEKKGGNR
jgi:integrase/recombinase XerD